MRIVDPILESERGAQQSAGSNNTRNGKSDSGEEKVRVALFLPSMVSGGAERVMLHLASGLADRGILVDLVLSSAKGPYMAHVPKNVRVVDLHSKRVLTSLPKLVRYLRRNRPSALLSALAHANLIALWASWLAGANTRVVVAVHSTLSLSTRFSPRRRDRMVPWLTHMSYRRAAKVVAVSTGSARDLIKLTDIDPNLVHVIPNPVITEQLFKLAARPVEDPWFSNDSLPLLITVGRLTAAKNYPLLLKAFQRLLDKKDARLVILGDGEERSELERLVREYGIEAQVKMPGYVDNPWAYMSKADLFVLSSKWEGLPTVLVEALALGIRVVSTDCEFGPRELLKDGKFGWLVPSEDYVALADTMLTALNAELPKVDLADLGAFRLDNAVDSYARLLGVDRKRGPET